MKSLNLLIKPASSSCNLRCKYCFYYDISENRDIKNYGIMKEDILEKMIKRVFEEVEESVTFAFQGGEPTVAGLSYFEKFHQLVNKYNTKNIFITYTIQTNGTLIDKKWIPILKKYNYLVGISLDGNKEVHDSFRKDNENLGTFNRVLKTIKLLKKEEIDFNILTVVNKLTVKEGKIIYNFFKNSGFKYLQFIPCLDNLYSNEKEDYTLEAEDYGKFLNDIFDEWYNDILSNKKISIRYFDNILKIILGNEPESCDMIGHCNINGIIEADGSVYPCDFYVLDDLRLGNINENSFLELFTGEKAKKFMTFSFGMDNSCKICKYYRLCRGGCKRHKENDGVNGYKNKFCRSYKMFFDKNLDKLIRLSKYIINRS